MKEIVIALIGLVLILQGITIAAEKDLEIQGKKLISQKPHFTLGLPSEFRLIHSFSHENPRENSLTRVYFFLKMKDKQIEEMMIVQIADKTNPQAGPILVPHLKPYTEKRMYLKDMVKKRGVEVDYMTQLMAWNPDAPSLQPLIEKGILIPSRWALQGQFLFTYLEEHAIFVRYSKDTNSFGLKVSEEGDIWNRDSIKGNEKKVYEIFQKTFMGMVNSIEIKNP
ncbi:MAG: hypothetical protein AB1502_01110 [Thermodesulfobacteriota bacterium]